MRRTIAAVTLLLALGVLLLVSGGSRRSIEAANPPTPPAPAPLLTCGDLNANGPVDGGDFFRVLVDFNQDCPDADTQIALATRWGLGLSVPPSCSPQPPAAPNPSPPLTENAAALSAIGYTGGGQDVPGQGKHYLKLANWGTGFDPCRPEGLVYDNGKLVAQLYYINGVHVGWGPEPAPIDNVDIDAFCNTVPNYGGGPCSWSNDNGPEAIDGWHLHEDLCVINLGQPNSLLFPTPDSATCQAAAGGGSWVWFERLGWMGHLWNHELSGNGRLADCAPDPAGYSAFYNGAKGFFGPYDCPQ